VYAFGILGIAWSSDSERMKNNTRLIRCILISFFLTPTLNEAKGSPVERTDEKPHLTGDWGGARSRLTGKGVELNFIYKFEFNETLAGGLNRGAKTFGNFDARTALDLEKLAGLKGASVFLYGLGNHGGDPSKNIGDNQVSSSIETPVDTFRLYEAWFQQLFFDDKASILVGLHDLNSEFYATDSSSLFFNSSFGVGRSISQTGVNGPSIFPVTAPSLRLRVEPSKNCYAQAALFNGVAGQMREPHGTHMRISPDDDGLFQIAEVGYNQTEEKNSDSLPAKYAVGAWSYSKSLDDVSGTKKTLNFGAYLLFDQSISDYFAIFIRAGLGNPDANTVASDHQTGIVGKGLIPGRAEDKVGLAFTTVSFSEPYRRAQATAGNDILATETSIELNYRAILGGGLVVQPDFQYVLTPSGSTTVPFASVFAIRTEFNF
jgi:porin